MAGWVKLWRKMKENGHLKMPGTAFKLWIYCLLEATPYPDQEQDLAAGELWLSYENIRRAISEEGTKIGKSTVSGALKYLSQNGYIELQAIKFKGIKARVINWAAYQGAADKSVESCYRTRQVPSQDPPSPLPGPYESSHRTREGTRALQRRGFQPA